MNKLALIALAGGLLLAPTTARAQFYDDDPYPIAPPVGGRYSNRFDDAYDWRDVPSGERIPIVRASLDRDGYRLFDDRGQLIIVPFENDNLYIMRFGRTMGRTYFVREGGVPTLYLPEGGYIENLAVSGVRWYPFPQRYYYSRPIFIGPAPSWNDYCTMGWYPGMVYYGGWWDYNPWRYGCRFAPLSGWSISIGNFSYTRWDDYCDYWRVTPARRVIFVDRSTYYSPRVIYRDQDRYPYVRNEPQKDRLVRPGSYDYSRSDRFDRDRDDRFSRSGGSFGSSSSSRDDRFSRSGSFEWGRSPSPSPSRSSGSSGRSSSSRERESRRQ
jgi:hypothetical protein